YLKKDENILSEFTKFLYPAVHLYDGICCNRIQLFSIKIQGKNWVKKDSDTTQDKQHQNAVAIFHLVTGYDCLGDIA
ncbi:hypothetical protein TNCT_522101, partial [Trichonephila clavata]